MTEQLLYPEPMVIICEAECREGRDGLYLAVTRRESV